MSSSLPAFNPTGYLGTNDTNPGQLHFRDRNPINLQDVHNYSPGDTWINTTGNQIWMLTKIVNQVPPLTKLASWVNITGAGGGGILTLTPDDANVVSPVAGNCNIYGDPNQGVSTSGVSPSLFVTVANATTASKGVAQFNPVDFNVAAGIVSLTGGPGAAFWAATFGPQILTPNHGWIATNAGGTTFTLPAVSAQGDAVAVQGQGAGGWVIHQLAGQQIIFNSVSHTTPGAGGSVSSTDAYDSIYLVCLTANLIWLAVNYKGNLAFV